MKLSLKPRTFPARIADLGFTVKLPEDWIAHDLPDEEPDFTNPAQLVPLAIVTAPHSAIVFAFAARPGYENGSLHDWAWYLLKNNQLVPRAIGAGQLGSLPAVLGEATQESDVGTMVVRFAFAEDGGRLVNMTLSAPELLSDAVKDAWFAAVASFTLSTPRGSTVALEAAPEASSEDEPEPPAAADASPEPYRASMGNTFAGHSLGNDTTSLDQETTINANLRDKGSGLVPRVVSADDATKRATVAAGAILALFDVPYGWHVIDDGRRTLVFEPSGKVQINLNLIPREGRSNTEILDAIETDALESYPEPQFMRLFEGGIDGLGVRNIHDGGVAIEQYHMMVPGRDAETALRARVTATPECSADACNLADLILKSVVYDPASAPDGPVSGSDDPPAWWRKAQALEAEDRLDEAEKAILSGVDHIGAAASVAEMYKLRMLRLKESGDLEGAREAFRKADHWIVTYASWATSGGEGAALSLQRDEFLAELKRLDRL